MLWHWSQFVLNMSANIRGHEALLHHQTQWSLNCMPWLKAKLWQNTLLCMLHQLEIVHFFHEVKGWQQKWKRLRPWVYMQTQLGTCSLPPALAIGSTEKSWEELQDGSCMTTGKRHQFTHGWNDPQTTVAAPPGSFLQVLQWIDLCRFHLLSYTCQHQTTKEKS